jgi:hypothetical protein
VSTTTSLTSLRGEQDVFPLAANVRGDGQGGRCDLCDASTAASVHPLAARTDPHFADLRFVVEVLEPPDISAEGKVTGAELSIAKTLVGQMAGKFSAGKFKDTYHADLKRRVQEKIKNKQTHSLDVEMPPSEARHSAQVIGVAAALKVSLAQRQGRSTGRAAARPMVKTRKRAKRGRSE